jgi:hypothetical protein
MSRRALLGLLPLSLASLLLGWALIPAPSAADEPGAYAKDKPITKEVTPQYVQFPNEAITVTRALEELKKQTGIEVMDERQNKDDSKIKLDVNKVLFWEALENIAKEADARVNLYREDTKLALGDGPYRALPISYSGIFRVTVNRLVAERDLVTDTHQYRATLEVAWQPGFRPFFIETRPSSIVVQDEKQRTLDTIEEMPGRDDVKARTATIDVRLPAPPRSATKLGLLKGNAAIIGPKKWLTFAFDDLGKLKDDAAGRVQSKEGVTAKLSKLGFDEDVWTVELTLDYPADGPKFESFESWVVYNEITLKKPDAVPFPNNGGYETGNTAGTRAIISYHFLDEPKKKLVRGKPDGWKLEYITPAPFVEFPVAFDFKDLVLP